jgi:adenosylcobinamide-GDP ribazoletransferase
MNLRGLHIATQFLTRLPIPAVRDLQAEELSRAAPWFPLIGLGLGALILGAGLLARPYGDLLAAALALLVWVAVSGALHLDGLADLTDALAASHRDPQRFLAVLADPHIGTFGVVSVVLTLLLKFAALAQLTQPALGALLLLPAWGRLGPLLWARSLPPLKPGRGADFARQLRRGWIIAWVVLLSAASLCVAPVLCIAVAVVPAFGGWLRWRVGGVNGDCLGAGVEVTETLLVLALAVAGPAGALLHQQS